LSTLVSIFFSLMALAWIIAAVVIGRGMSKIPFMSEAPDPEGQPLPRISIIFAARDEAEKLPPALATFQHLDYPNYEIIAADDRSVDATAAILDAAAASNANFKAVHVAELPDGWLGKPHALETAYRQATGEWIVFTDADVRFAPKVLRKALGLMELKGWDHLTILADIDMHGFWEITAIAFFGMGFVLGTQPWRVSNPHSPAYMGVGAFQMVRRSAYEKIGTHQRLRMEVIDDMKLGKLLKESGFRSGLAVSQNFVRVRWQEGFAAIVRGVTKNMFAGFQFKIGYALFAIAGMTLISIVPTVALFFTHGLTQFAAAVCVATSMALEGLLLMETDVSPFYGMTHPLGAAVFIYMVLRSMLITLRQGGIIWRGTFYPLKKLKRGIV
jgi:cellulose synthase/poly-beta-1,6-N-acetylglucosamine synthase-like glycosyltransferase